MKNKKLSVQSIILLCAVSAIVLVSLIMSIAVKPTVTESEFPFTITYELDGETVTIDEVYKAYYTGNAGYADTKSRMYEGRIGDLDEGEITFTLKKDETGRIELYTKLYADFLMGDSEYDYFDDEAFEPCIYYYDLEEQEFCDEETLAEHGVKLIDFEYPTPIKNSFVFSHLSHLSGIVSLPALLISLLALLAIMIFVKKEKELKYNALDIISIVLNFIVFFTVVPITAIFALFIDIEGGGPEFYYQGVYFIPAISALGIAVSVALRRKGRRVLSFFSEFAGIAAFGLYLLICLLAGCF